MTNIRSIDLNLLVVLDALLRSGSVSQAAKLVGLSQPATSAALGRLREILKDPLFVRSSRTMHPTPRALELRLPVSELVASIEATLFGGAQFDPASSEITVKISVDDYIGHVFLSSFLSGIQKLAPGVRVECVLADHPEPHRELVSGDLDIAVRVSGYRGAGVYQKKLLDEQFLTIARKGHPQLKNLTQSGLALKAFVELKHLLVSPYGGLSGLVDEALEKKGLKRDVVAAVPHFGVAPLTIASSDMIATLPARIAKAAVRSLPLTIFDTPISMSGFSMYMLWHERTNRHPGYRWIRDQLLAAAQSASELK